MPVPEFITSAANPLLKEVRRTLVRGELTTGGHCVVETFHLLEEALRSQCRVRTVIAAESARTTVESQIANREGIRLVIVPDQLLNATAAVISSQGVVAVVEPPQWTLAQTIGTSLAQSQGAQPLLVVVNGVQDPGNLGTILRSAEAFAATGVLLLKGTVSPFNSKALRASAGSLFRVPLVNGLDEASTLAFLQQSEIETYAAIPGAESRNSFADADLTRPCAFVIGSEGQGVSAKIQSATKPISIPTCGVESLNAAVSAAILMYEARRQRSQMP